MTSGYSEKGITEDVNESTANVFLFKSSDMDNTLLLLVVIGLCVVIVMLLSCILFLVCRKNLWKKKRFKSKAVLSKATSVTGLSETPLIGSPNNNLTVANIQPVDINTNCNVTTLKFKTPTKSSVVTSTPADTKVLSDQHGALTDKSESSPIFLSDISLKHSQDQNDTTVKPTFTETTFSAGDWVTALMTQASTDACMASYLLYTSASSNVLSVTTPSDESSKYLLHGSKNTSDKDDFSTSELTPLTEKDSTPLPVDSHSHPKAWFVPLDKMYHEPLRHSFIDVSSRKDYCTLNDKERPENNKNQETDDLKKSNIWKQREERPVLFLENPDDLSSPISSGS